MHIENPDLSLHYNYGVLAHLVERNTGSVEVSGSSPLCSTNTFTANNDTLFLSMVPAVSIIVPIYKVEKVLARCIDSIIQQSFSNIEVVLVDDGSPDNSGTIADSYAKRDNRIKVIHSKNEGLAKARQKGVNHATAPYVVFVDSDDELLPGAIEYLYHSIAESDVDIVCASYVRNYLGKESETTNPDTGFFTSDGYLEQLLLLGRICSSNCYNISKRAIWHDDVFPDKILPSEDVLISIKLSRYVKKAKICNHPVYRYYYTPGSLSISNRLSSQTTWKEYFRIIKEELNSRNLFKKFEKEYYIFAISRISFYINPIHTNDEWIQEVVNYDAKGLPAKSKILQQLIKFPRLLVFLVKANRKFKRLFS